VAGPTAVSSGSGDRRVCVRHELRDDLGEVNPGLSEVLAEVAAMTEAARWLIGLLLKETYDLQVSAIVVKGLVEPTPALTVVVRALNVQCRPSPNSGRQL